MLNQEVFHERHTLLLILVFAVLAFEQQPPLIHHPYTSPPTFPVEQTPRQEMPPDKKAPPPPELSTSVSNRTKIRPGQRAGITRSLPRTRERSCLVVLPPADLPPRSKADQSSDNAPQWVRRIRCVPISRKLQSWCHDSDILPKLALVHSWKTFRAKPNAIPIAGKDCSACPRNDVHFQAGMLFGIRTESCSASARNRVHLRPDSPLLTKITSNPARLLKN
jgi:hypothetical protein